MTASEPLLSLEGLSVAVGPEDDPVRLLDDTSLELAPGRTLCLVGESGSGKTLTALSVLGLLPRGVRRSGGRVCFGGRDLAQLSGRELRQVRGPEIGMVFQDPVANLDPSFTVGSQLVETLRTHTQMSRSQALARAAELLDRVGIAEPAKRLRDYPHQLSGGMAQRVMIALAISCRPRLLVADEPTTALDATVQAQILTLLRDLQDEHEMAVLLISHDLSVVAEMADEVAVMYAGQVVEQGEVTALFDQPEHPYTEALLAAQPGRVGASGRLAAIAGSVPPAGSFPSGCRFHPRCSYVADACRDVPPELLSVELDSPEGSDSVAVVGNGVSLSRASRCVQRAELSLRGVAMLVPAAPVAVAAPAPVVVAAPAAASGPTSEEDEAEGKAEAEGEPDEDLSSTPGAGPLVVASGLGKDYILRSGAWPWSRHRFVAVDEVDLDIAAGETLGLVGESGAGKTTVGRMVLGLEDPSRGSVLVDGMDIHGMRGRQRRSLRRDVQVVFQNPHSSLDPLMTVGQTLAEPLEVHTRWSRDRVEERVAELLEQVGMARAVAGRHPGALSGGQRQRVAIARALALEPRLIVCDEPVSALDVSTQAQVVNLLGDLQKELGVSYLFVGHDLSVVHQVSHRIAVMRRGQVVELGASDQVYNDPQHPYTRELVGAVLSGDPRRRRLGSAGPS